LELRFIQPSLRLLDLAATEVLVASIAVGDRPPRGVVGLADWRLRGRISSLVQREIVTGCLGEVVLVPGGPHLPFDKILLFGTGELTTFGDRVYRTVVEHMLRTLEGLRARSAVVELPGRDRNQIAPDKAADILLELAGNRPDHDVWTIVDGSEAQRAITQHMIQERRRVRR
jgi:hypothetical protein